MRAEYAADKRMAWVDTLKGIGIIFVVLGHQYTSDNFALTYIFSFHMPLFFFISGFLFKSGRYSGFTELLKDKALTRIVPYLVFFLVAYAFSVLRVSALTGLNVLAVIATDNFRPMFFQKAAILLKSSGESLQNVNNIALWFIPCLFVTELLFYALHTWTAADAKKIVAVLILAALGGYAESVFGNKSLPWAIDTALTALVFYGLGYAYRSFKLPPGVLYPGNKSMTLLMFCISTVMCLLFDKLNGRVDMNSNQYGNFVYFYAGAFSGIFSWLIIAPLFSGQPLLSFLGKNTLIILGTHLYLYDYAIDALNAISGLFLAKEETLLIQDDLYVITISLLVLIFIAPIAYGVNSFIPWVIGKKRAVRATTAERYLFFRPKR